MAEVYWDLEWTLQQQGFDYTYDNGCTTAYAKAIRGPVREHFRAGLDYQNKMARFLENQTSPAPRHLLHRECTRPRPQSPSCPPVCDSSTRGNSRGGRNASLPTSAAARCEPVDPKVREFYRRSARCAARARSCVTAGGSCSNAAGVGRQRDRGLLRGPGLARDGGSRLVVAVNYAPQSKPVPRPASVCGFYRWPVASAGSNDAALYDRDGNDLQSPGLFLGMSPWQDRRRFLDEDLLRHRESKTRIGPRSGPGDEAMGDMNVGQR